MFTWATRQKSPPPSPALPPPPSRPVPPQVEWFERSFQQNEELGLNDMNTDDYETLPEDCVRPSQLMTVAEDEEGTETSASHLIPHRVGTDHPTPFTKGQEEADTTETDGGVH